MVRNRSLKFQVVLIVSLVCTSIFSISYLYSAFEINSGFSKIELKDTEVNLSRVEAGLKAQYQSMINKLGDWAQWDDCYRYIEDKNEEFHKANLQSTLTLSKVNLYTFWNIKRELVWGANLNLKTEKESEKLYPLHGADIELIKSVDYLHEFLDYKDKRFLFANLKDGPYLLVSVPITTTDGKAPVNGKIITGVKLDEDFFKEMSLQLSLAIKSYRLDQELPDKTLAQIVKKFQERHTVITTHERDHLDAYGLIKDYQKRDLILYNLIIPREIHLQAKRTLIIFLVTMIITAIVMVILMLFVIDAFVLSKISKLLKVIKEVISTGNLKVKVPDLGKGEIGFLAHSFNEMVVEIDKLKTKSIQDEKMVSLGQMAGSISHEINNPMDIISGRVDNLRLKNETNSLTNEYLVESLLVIEKTVYRISKIVRGLRIISRTADADPFVIKNIKELIAETIEYCEDRLNKSEIKLRLKLDLICQIACREVQISQVLINLIRNSIDAIENLPERWIEIETAIEANRLKIYVTDSGLGISKDLSEKIMGPFFTTKGVGKGTGLGLSISKGIIEEHGGTLLLNMNSKNTQFVITLPISRDY